MGIKKEYSSATLVTEWPLEIISQLDGWFLQLLKMLTRIFSSLRFCCKCFSHIEVLPSYMGSRGGPH